jgi:GNAT superfamily N-acetyltransferase
MADSQIVIRAAVLADIESLTDLFEGYRAFYGKEAGREGAKAFLTERLTNGESVVYLAFDGDVAVGFTQLFPLFSSTRMRRIWLLNDLFVAPDYRGRGISKLLLDRAKQLAYDTDACEVMLETAKSNEVGNQLYPSAGFELGTTVNWYHWSR